MAINNSNMTMPESVWRAYIDNEIANKDYEYVREIYERLLERTKHIKIWVSYAQFEASIDSKDVCREILKRGEENFKDNPDSKEVKHHK